MLFIVDLFEISRNTYLFAGDFLFFHTISYFNKNLFLVDNGFDIFVVQ